MPEYVAATGCVPPASGPVVQVAWNAGPLALSATAPQPAMVLPSAENATVPVPSVGATVAVYVTDCPTFAGLAEALTDVVEATGAMTNSVARLYAAESDQRHRRADRQLHRGRRQHVGHGADAGLPVGVLAPCDGTA